MASDKVTGQAGGGNLPAHRCIERDESDGPVPLCGAIHLLCYWKFHSSDLTNRVCSEAVYPAIDR
jgi:hypothetical protein